MKNVGILRTIAYQWKSNTGPRYYWWGRPAIIYKLCAICAFPTTGSYLCIITNIIYERKGLIAVAVVSAVLVWLGIEYYGLRTIPTLFV